mgnify:CR=1 FL=1
MVLPNKNVPFGISTYQIRRGFHMNKTCDRMFCFTYKQDLFGQFLNFKRFVLIIVMEVKFIRIFGSYDFFGMNRPLEVPDIQMTQRWADCSGELHILLVDLRERIVLISSKVISDRFACQHHKYVSDMFYIDNIQNRINDLDWRRSLGFKVKGW